MKAQLTELSNQSTTKSNASSKPEATHTPTRGDSIHARLRRLEARIATLELKASTTRRDVDRIEKRQYRKIGSSVIKNEADSLDNQARDAWVSQTKEVESEMAGLFG